MNSCVRLISVSSNFSHRFGNAFSFLIKSASCSLASRCSRTVLGRTASWSSGAIKYPPPVPAYSTSILASRLLLRHDFLQTDLLRKAAWFPFWNSLSKFGLSPVLVQFEPQPPRFGVRFVSSCWHSKETHQSRQITAAD